MTSAVTCRNLSTAFVGTDLSKIVEMAVGNFLCLPFLWVLFVFLFFRSPGAGFDDQIPLPDAAPDHSPCLVWNELHNVSINAPTRCPGPMNFTKLGHRGVSAMMSPWVGKQAIFQKPKAAPPPGKPPRQYDHTSMLASAKSFFQLGGFLTERDAWAGTFDELLLDVPRQQGDMPMHLPDAPEPSTPWKPWQPAGPPSPPPPPPPSPTPAGKRWQCFNGTNVPSTRDWSVPSLNLTGVDYTSGFTDLTSCESHCNGCYNVTGGCIALEFHFTDRHCVCYSGTSLDEAAFESILTKQKLGTWSSCMLVTEVRPSVDSRRRLELETSTPSIFTDVAPPQHCSQSVPEGACLGPHVVTQKQRNLLELYSALTHTPMPDVDNMGYVDAQAWNRARYSEYLAMIR
eukprot:COSAG02_NODE_2926_length_7728_cov_3.194521_6_plen_399_part_00